MRKLEQIANEFFRAACVYVAQSRMRTAETRDEVAYLYMQFCAATDAYYAKRGREPRDMYVAIARDLDSDVYAMYDYITREYPHGVNNTGDTV